MEKYTGCVWPKPGSEALWTAFAVMCIRTQQQLGPRVATASRHRRLPRRVSFCRHRAQFQRVFTVAEEAEDRHLGGRSGCHAHLMRQSKAANTRVRSSRRSTGRGPPATAPDAACRSIDVRPVDVLSRLLALAVTCWLERKRPADPRCCSFFRVALWKAANLDD